MHSMAHMISDAEILAALKEGERERAITDFVRAHQAFIYSVALRQMRHHDDALDIAQDVLVKAIEGLERFKGESTLRTWLYRITLNTCVSVHRKRRFLSFFAIGEGEGERDVQAGGRDPLEQAATVDFEQFFATVLDGLPTKQRETFCLRYYDQLSYEEISAMTGTSVGALKANYHWAVKKIADRLRGTDYYEDLYENR
jgi:RNA polymerase sigma factor (sigma-70 family)